MGKPETLDGRSSGLGAGTARSLSQKRLYSVLKAPVLGGDPGSVFEVTERRSRDLRVPVPLPRWAYSSVGLEHTPDKREVGSSNLPRPTKSGVRGQVPGVRYEGGEPFPPEP